MTRRMGEAPSPREPHLDVALVLHHTIQAFGRDFAGVVLGGVVLVTLPGVIARELAGGGELGTLLTTLRAVCAMLYLALVSFGIVMRLRGRALPPRDFVREGLRRATPGVQVALLAGAAVVAGLTLQLFARHGTVEGWLLDVLLLTAGLWAVSVAMPVVPAAVVEQLGPVAAFRRAAALTAGNRNRILALALMAAMTLAPSGALVAGVAGPLAIGGLAHVMFELFAWALAATLPAAVYAGLQG